MGCRISRTESTTLELRGGVPVAGIDDGTAEPRAPRPGTQQSSEWSGADDYEPCQEAGRLDTEPASDTESRRTPNPLDPISRDQTPSFGGSTRSELDVSTVEVDIGEKTPPLTLVAIVTAFAQDLAVQRHALRYLALSAYEAQTELSREDVVTQLLRALERALEAFRDPPEGSFEPHRSIDIGALSPPEHPP
eukprot:Hpha_TRINITY_DN732_c0_g1::TRINITY_DN732_c0_g1_i1::g.28950::m.28950